MNERETEISMYICINYLKKYNFVQTINSRIKDEVNLFLLGRKRDFPLFIFRINVIMRATRRFREIKKENETEETERQACHARNEVF